MNTNLISNAKSNFLLELVPFMETVEILHAAELGYPRILRMVNRWAGELKAAKKAEAFTDPRTVLRARYLAMSNSGCAIDHSLRIDGAWWVFICGILEGMMLGPEIFTDDMTGGHITRHEAERKAERTAEAEFDMWMGNLAPYVGQDLPSYWGHVDKYIAQMEK